MVLTITLPGGLWRENRLRRTAVFHPLTGRIEQAFLEMNAQGSALPERVTDLLALALDRIDDLPVGPEEAADLCMADRRLLMMRLAGHIERDPVWFKSACVQCQAPFDISLDRNRLPVKEGAGEYPFATVSLQGRKVRMRMPTGADQQRITHLTDEDRALHSLLSACVIEVDDAPPPPAFVGGLQRSEIAVLEDALEAAAPDVATQLQADCPECGQGQVIPLDPYGFTGRSADRLYGEVHTLASFYHWNEEDILALPQARRCLYLDLIDKARGFHH